MVVTCRKIIVVLKKKKKKKKKKRNLQTICSIQNRLKLFIVDEHETKEKEKKEQKAKLVLLNHS